MKKILSLIILLLLCIPTSFAKTKELFKVYDATFALYVSSESAQKKDVFTCTADAIAKVPGGYELLSAGHCTPADIEELPEDMTFSVSEQIGGPLMPVQLVKAALNEPIDYSIFYLKTTNSYPVLDLNDDRRIGDKVLVGNCTEGVVKQVAEGSIVSGPLGTDPDLSVKGMFEIQIMAGPGASGSAVVDERTGGVIGILVMGMSGEFVLIEPIDNVDMSGVTMPPAPDAKPVIVVDPAALKNSSIGFVLGLVRLVL